MWVVLQMMDGDQDQDLDQCGAQWPGLVHHSTLMCNWFGTQATVGFAGLIPVPARPAELESTQVGEFSTLGLEQIVFYTRVES